MEGNWKTEYQKINMITNIALKDKRACILRWDVTTPRQTPSSSRSTSRSELTLCTSDFWHNWETFSHVKTKIPEKKGVQPNVATTAPVLTVFWKANSPKLCCDTIQRKEYGGTLKPGVSWLADIPSYVIRTSFSCYSNPTWRLKLSEKQVQQGAA